MLDLGIVGSDNSHAIHFAQIANESELGADRCRVVGIWGSEEERTEEVAAEGNIDRIYDEYGAMVDDVDAALVVDRHGDRHRDHAMPFLEAGLPTFVDKPFAVSLDDVREMIETARANDAAVTSFSTVRFAPETVALAERVEEVGAVKAAQLAGPCDFESQYAGPFFYATHVVAMGAALLGEDVQTVRAHRSGDTVTVTVDWGADAGVAITYVTDAAYQFRATVFGTDDAFGAEVSLDGCYEAGFEVIVEMFETGEWPLSEEQLIRPIAFVHAVQESLDQDGRPVAVETDV